MKPPPGNFNDRRIQCRGCFEMVADVDSRCRCERCQGKEQQPGRASSATTPREAVRQDIFDVEYPWADTLCIVASGSSGCGKLHRIPARSTALALNSSILHYKWFDWWMIADCTAPRKIPEFEDQGGGALRVFADNVEQRADFRFQQDPPGETPLPRVLRCGATVLGQALQLALHFRLNVAILGADMGDRYFDGTPTHGVFDRYHDRLGNWIRLLQAEGLGVEFLTPSPLEVFVRG